jgi:SAM-dependent methyltransferase
MRRLAAAHEHLDGELGDRHVLAGNLRDLVRINRVFGGSALSIRAIRGLVEAAPTIPDPRGRVLRVLDVGTGAADIPRAMLPARGPWREVTVTAVDSRPEVIDAAVSLAPELRTTPGLELSVADGLALPFADHAFDVAHSSMVLHHLEPGEVVRFLRELDRVAGIGIVINDLARSRLGWLGAWLVLHLLTRNRFTLHDGPLSVRRAYTRVEALDLLASEGLRPVGSVAGLAGHRWAIAAVRA